MSMAEPIPREVDLEVVEPDRQNDTGPSYEWKSFWKRAYSGPDGARECLELLNRSDAELTSAERSERDILVMNMGGEGWGRLFSACEPLDQLRAVAVANRLAGSIYWADIFRWQLAENADQLLDRLDTLREQLAERPVTEQLEIVNAAVDISPDIFNTGETYQGIEGRRRLTEEIRTFVQQLRSPLLAPLVDYAIAAADSEGLPSSDNQTPFDLRERVDSPLLGARDHVYQLSKDTVSIVDRQNIPRFYGRPVEGAVNTNPIPVEFYPYDNLTSDPIVHPFGDSSRHDLPLLMQQLHRPAVKQVMSADLHVALERLSLGAQVHLMEFLSNQDRSRFDRIRAILQQDLPYREDFLASFLACADDYSFGDHLIALTEAYEVPVLQKVFHSYRSLADKSEEVEIYLQSHFPEQLSAHPELKEQIARSLLLKGKQLLELAAIHHLPPQTLEDNLEAADADLLLLMNAIKSLVKLCEPVELNRLPEMHAEVWAGGSLPPKMAGQIQKIGEINWRRREHMFDEVMSNLQAALEKSSTNWHLLLRGEKLLGFFRLDKAQEDELYFGSFNVAPSERGYALAAVMLNEMFVQATGDKLVEAHCDPWDPVTEQYLATGFVATELISYSGQPAFTIVRDDRPEKRGELNWRWSALDYQQLQDRAAANPDQVVAYTFSKDPVRQPGDPENERFQADLRRRLNSGREVVTNLRFGPRQTDGSRSVLVAYEPRPNSFGTTPGASLPDTDPQ